VTKKDKARRLALIRRVHRKMVKRAAELADPEPEPAEPAEPADDLPEV